MIGGIFWAWVLMVVMCAFVLISGIAAAVTALWVQFQLWLLR